jgi:hypothetical protein
VIDVSRVDLRIDDLLIHVAEAALGLEEAGEKLSSLISGEAVQT